MQDWIETTSPPGVWVWSDASWKWYPPPDMSNGGDRFSSPEAFLKSVEDELRNAS